MNYHGNVTPKLACTAEAMAHGNVNSTDVRDLNFVDFPDVYELVRLVRSAPLVQFGRGDVRDRTFHETNLRSLGARHFFQHFVFRTLPFCEAFWKAVKERITAQAQT